MLSNTWRIYKFLHLKLVWHSIFVCHRADYVIVIMISHVTFLVKSVVWDTVVTRSSKIMFAREEIRWRHIPVGPHCSVKCLTCYPLHLHGVYTLRNTAKINAFSGTNNAIIVSKHGVREEGTCKIRREKYHKHVRYFKISVYGTRCYHNYMSITPWCTKKTIY